MSKFELCRGRLLMYILRSTLWTTIVINNAGPQRTREGFFKTEKNCRF